jgi:cytochrome c peroxidase
MLCARHTPAFVCLATSILIVPAGSAGKKRVDSRNDSGVSRTLSTHGGIDKTNPFFLPLGQNGRQCDTCHQPAQGWSLTPKGVQKTFAKTQGLDPLFRLNDGSNTPLADDKSLEQRQAAYSMLLNRGVIRIEMAVQPEFEFRVVGVNDPYGYANATRLSLFRRPLPATNLRFNTEIMWDGRETKPGLTFEQQLSNQASGAITGHAQAPSPPNQTNLDAIVQFETGLISAQSEDKKAGALSKKRGLGGPERLKDEAFSEGLNNPFESAFDRNVFTLFADWLPRGAQTAARAKSAQQSIARGEEIFNTREFSSEGVGGLNDVLGQSSVRATCSTCHNAPNSGSHTLKGFFDFGVSGFGNRPADLPLYTLQNKESGNVIDTSDPGRAMITGKWSDVGRFKTPALRNLAARPPYFHNGTAATLEDVVEFYNRRFNMNLPPQEKLDLANFLKAL